MRRVVVLAVDGCQLLDVAGPVDVFDAAGRLVSDGYHIQLATMRGADVRTESGLRLGANVMLGQVRGPLDTLMVAGGLGIERARGDRELLDELRRLARGCRRIASVCTGASLLAEAGLLDGCRVTTHWSRCGELQRRHPRLRVEPDRIFVRDGRVATSAGVTAGMDLALALVEEDHGPAIARAVARWLVLFLRRPGGQSQFADRFTPPMPRHASLRAVIDAIIVDPAADHRIEALASRAAVSERHFARRFAAEMRMTPARFVERVRVEAARTAIEQGSTVEAAARRSGFSSSEVMRRAFLRVLGVGPSEYRDRFTTTLEVAS